MAVVQATIFPNPNVETPGKITFAPRSVKAGTTVTFEIKNTDPATAHVFEINGRLTRFIPAGKIRQLKNVVFKHPGHYVGSCPDDDRGTGGVLIVN